MGRKRLTETGQIEKSRKLTPFWSAPLGVDRDQAADLTACDQNGECSPGQGCGF
jgi:hypothetical protein